MQYCGKCGAENKDGEKFCVECGNPLEVTIPKKTVTNTPQATPPKKKRTGLWIGLGIGVLVIIILFASCGACIGAIGKSASSTTTEQNAATTEENKVYGLGETWTVDGLFSLTFTSVIQTEDRNQFSEKTPAQVVILTYDYENIGYDGDLYIGINKIIDANGEMANTYPIMITTYPQPTPIGAKCVGAQGAYGLNNASSEITVIIEEYGNSFDAHTATFKLAI